MWKDTHCISCHSSRICFQSGCCLSVLQKKYSIIFETDYDVPLAREGRSAEAQHFKKVLCFYMTFSSHCVLIHLFCPLWFLCSVCICPFWSFNVMLQNIFSQLLTANGYIERSFRELQLSFLLWQTTKLHQALWLCVGISYGKSVMALQMQMSINPIWFVRFISISCNV